MYLQFLKFDVNQIELISGRLQGLLQPKLEENKLGTAEIQRIIRTLIRRLPIPIKSPLARTTGQVSRSLTKKLILAEHHIKSGDQSPSTMGSDRLHRSCSITETVAEVAQANLSSIDYTTWDPLSHQNETINPRSGR